MPADRPRVGPAWCPIPNIETENHACFLWDFAGESNLLAFSDKTLTRLRSGKSSIASVVFHKMPPNETLFLESTTRIQKDSIQ